MAYIRKCRPKTPEERQAKIIEKIKGFAEAMSELRGNGQEIADDLAEKFGIKLPQSSSASELPKESE